MNEIMMLSGRLRVRDCKPIRLWILERLIKGEFGEPESWREIGAFASARLLQNIARCYHPDADGLVALGKLPRFYRDGALDEAQDLPMASASGGAKRAGDGVMPVVTPAPLAPNR